MRPQNVRAFETQRCLRSKRSVETLLGWNVFPVSTESAADKRFSRSARQQRKSRHLQFVEAPQQRIVLVETLPKSKTRIEHDPLAPQPGQNCLLGPVLEFP